MDLVFAIDTSSDVDSSKFDQMKNFIKASLQSYQVSPSRDHVGIITYGENAKTSLPLSRGSNNNNIRSILDSMPRVDGQRKISSAVEHARRTAFSLSEGSRGNVSKMLVLFVAGKNDVSDNAQLQSYADTLRSAGIQMIVVEIGEHAQKSDLVRMLESGADYINTPSADSLPGVYGVLEQRIAKSTGLNICNCYSSFLLMPL